MKSIHNFSALEADPANNFWQNRAFQYGDGLFETIIFRGGAARYLAGHYGRLTAGMAVLDLAVPDGFTRHYLQEAIDGLVGANAPGGPARVKVQVWRRPGGLYTPESREAEFLVTVVPLPQPAPTQRHHVRFWEEMRLHASPLSRFKTCSALPYVLAGLARRRLGADEVILLDGSGHVAECAASNLFWLRGGTLYTPSLASGCVAGIMRGQILAQASRYGLRVAEGLYPPAELLGAEVVFCCNVAGHQFLTWIEGQPFTAAVPPELTRLLEGLYA
ncbi:MAG: aminotransferase class IV [Cytophagales bacterium]|nr:aminotransferase class IV [Cytophagales bacterium]